VASSLIFLAPWGNGLKRPFSLLECPAHAGASHRQTIHSERVAILEEQQDDISGQEIKQLLLDLMQYAGQERVARPALELEIGDIVTRTSVEPAGIDLYLCVTATLPPCDAPVTASLAPPAALADTLPGSCDFLWHADEGRYVLVRKISLRALTDERGVMDEILVTADLAAQCFDEIRPEPPRRR